MKKQDSTTTVGLYQTVRLSKAIKFNYYQQSSVATNLFQFVISVTC